MSFAALGLRAELIRAVARQGYTKPTPVQCQAIPVVLEGKDVLAGAQTGTGKTAGFALPVLQQLSRDPRPQQAKRLRALILTPTRELAAQVEESVATYGKYLQIESTCIYGGVKINPQIARLRRGVDILVATPGRLLDHAQQRTVDLSAVEVLVLDEADRMLDMGFIRDIKRILSLLPKRRQNLLFFATFSKEIQTLANELLNSPVLIEVSRRNAAAESIEQRVHPVDRTRKRELLSHLISTKGWRQVLVFTRTKHGANKLSKQLGQDGISSAALHGNKSQATRTRTLAEFKDGTIRVLVATDIAARGLNIDLLPHVVNFELPNVSEDYVHRIGRTGRAEHEGAAVSLVSIDEIDQLKSIERLLKHRIPEEVIEGYEPDPAIPRESVAQVRNGSDKCRQDGRPARKSVGGLPGSSRVVSRGHEPERKPSRGMARKARSE